MKWISVKDRLPVAGKYVVKAERPHYALRGQKVERKIEIRLSFLVDEEGVEHPSWDIHQQVVTHWLDESTAEERLMKHVRTVMNPSRLTG